MGAGGADHAQQHAFAQAAVGDDDAGGGPGAQDGGEDGAARQHELDAVGADAGVGAEAVGSEGSQQVEGGFGIFAGEDGAVDELAAVVFQAEGDAGERGDRAGCAQQCDAAVAQFELDAVGLFEMGEAGGDVVDHGVEARVGGAGRAELLGEGDDADG